MKNIFSVLVIFSLLTFSCKPTNKTVEIQRDNLKVDTSLPWSQRMAETVIKKYPTLWEIEDRNKAKWGYTYGLISLALQDEWKHTQIEKYYNYSKAYLDSLITDKGEILTYDKEAYNIDKINSGKILFDIYNRTGEQQFKIAIDTLRQQLREHPRTTVKGFWHKKRYPNQMWLDGLYMGAPFYARYAYEYNDPEGFNDVGNWIVQMEKVARDEKTGLLYHGWDESREQKWSDPQTGLSQNFWGRGMGWYGMAIVDVLDYFPEDQPYRDSIIAIIGRMAEAIIKVQDSTTGVWYQVLDQGSREGNFLEGSVSSMFSYFLLKSIRKGYIGTEYLDNAKQGFLGITKNLIKVEDNGYIIITPVCAVAGLGGNPYRDGSYDYYIHEKLRDNDPKAVGPFILAAIEYEKLIENK